MIAVKVLYAIRLIGSLLPRAVSGSQRITSTVRNMRQRKGVRRSGILAQKAGDALV
jgi:hypothetical protein